ncbi:dephospho-CoA kinase [Corynebacterium choanae]|uniref:Dephospho-CoA kinase n=1 Tax=Corynebacterium choanae TaxID=1862358 RepID=A0A3G6J668_9CORY|nr:dephospho-CoA kinase [Corynebacterium choanae]AZA13446.1 Dephospho-CoA kinase [Corynebacterium choanae]
MDIVGLTGGIGSGKTTVAALFADHGFAIVDADELARAAVATGSPALPLLAETFGADILNPDGSLHRGALAARAFRDSAATAKLNAIVHPMVAAAAKQRFQALAQDPATVGIIYDVPLLLENRREDEFAKIVVVHCPEALRLTRLTTQRGMTKADAQRRMKAQVTDEQRLAAADIVIDNSGSLEHTRQQVAAAAAQLKSYLQPSSSA